MTDFNMYNKVPYNVVVPEFHPEREAPIYPYIVRKYQCQEDLLRVDGGVNQFDRLTWKIQQPDSTMVWTAVKLVMPMEIQAIDGANNPIDMRVSSRLPACNVALSESPMRAFRQTSLSINGKIFSEENVFRRILDTCYTGTGAQSYGDNHSLKPVVCRNMKRAAADEDFLLYQANGDVTTNYTKIETDHVTVLDDAFSLLEHNSPFLERARLWQDQLSFDGLSWKGDISSYLELGPFQARNRKTNTAVPYIQDFFLLLNFDTNPSRFDGIHAPEAHLQTYNLTKARAMATKLLEFGTVANLKHHGESVNVHGAAFAKYFNFKWTAKPYLEITYTKFLQKMNPYYNLRCFEHQLEKSNDFQLAPPR